MRGASITNPATACCQGITPAHAGSIAVEWTSACLIRDHPRACGEHCLNSDPASAISGSPPRMRGASILPGLPQPGKGITPAHAGSIAVYDE